MAFRWYVVHTYSGFENRVKLSLQERIETAGKQAFFSDILIPEEDIVELVSGEKKTSKRKFFPGYILVQMEMNEETWHIVRSTPKITGFVGGGKNPPSIPDEDVARITSRITEGTMKPKAKYTFEKGESIRVIDGPFQNFNGVVDEDTSDFVLDISGSTQFGDDFNIDAVSQDGFGPGQLVGTDISENGILFARYTNGQSQILGQIILADFRNPQGLTALGNTQWAESFESGQPTRGVATAGVFGSLQAGALEDSNVDISEELVNNLLK